jgi:methylisocitrate lyase
MTATDVTTTAGGLLRALVERDKPLQVVGAINAYAAKLAERTGFKALYLSGGGVAASSCGVPDLGITTLEDVLIDARRITDACALPLLVDIDTGWGTAFNIARAIRAMSRAGVAAVHIEDQEHAKRCGHRPGKAIVPVEEMVDRIKAAVDAKDDASFVIMARTDALAVEGLAAAVDRACACVAAGADMVFPEAASDLATYATFSRAVAVPILANITEFGKTPLFTRAELASAGVSLALYPLSAFRAMSKAALGVYETILRDGTQQASLDAMQTREELYDVLGYHAFEQKLDNLLARSRG